MTRNIFTLLVFFSIVSTIDAQLKCDYEAITFQNVTPLWRHLTIDSSIIGYTDTTATNQQFYQDGMEHLSFDAGSFVEGGYLYTLTENMIDHDISSAVIEKVDLETGKLEWQIIEDIRTEPYREVVLQTSVVDDQFIVYGVREDQPDSSSTHTVNFYGQLEGVYYRKVYDLHTGERLASFTPSDTDSLKAIINFSALSPSSRGHFFSEDSLIHFTDRRNFFPDGRGFYLTKNVVDSNGYAISGPDTVVVGRFSDRPHVEAVINRRKTLYLTEEETFLHIEQYSPEVGFDHTFEAILTEYDQDFNVIREVDLKELGLDVFSQISIAEISKEYIVVKGCYNLQNSSFIICDDFFMLLDRDFNLIYEAHLDGYDGFVNNGTVNLFPDGRIYYANRNLNFTEGGFSDFEVWEVTEDGEDQLVRRVQLSIPDWGGFIQHLFVLEDGDLLIQFTHSCFVDGRKNSWHPEWFRFDIEEFLDRTSTEDQLLTDRDLIISPNPVDILLHIDNKSDLQGLVEIYDIDGRLIESNELNQPELTFETGAFSPGLYTLRLLNENGISIVRKFVKL